MLTGKRQEKKRMQPKVIPCWKCGAEVDLIDGKVPFRAVCEKCGFSTHACVNCQNYKRGLPNDCRIPGTDFVADREAGNFCEEFVPLTGKPDQGADVNDVAAQLFGDDVEDDLKSPSIDSLFDD